MSGPAGMTPPPAPTTLGPQSFCNACGQQIDARAEICPRCGVRQRAAAGSGSGKDRVVTIILALLLGWIGGHKFYLGKVAQGVIYLLFSWTGIPGLVAWIEAIVYLMTSDESWAATHGGPPRQSSGLAIGCLWLLALLPLLSIVAIIALIFMGNQVSYIMSNVGTSI